MAKWLSDIHTQVKELGLSIPMSETLLSWLRKCMSQNNMKNTKSSEQHTIQAITDTESSSLSVITSVALQSFLSPFQLWMSQKKRNGTLHIRVNGILKKDYDCSLIQSDNCKSIEKRSCRPAVLLNNPTIQFPTCHQLSSPPLKYKSWEKKTWINYK